VFGAMFSLLDLAWYTGTLLAALLLTASKYTSSARPCMLVTIIASAAAERWAMRSLPLMHDPLTVRRDESGCLVSASFPTAPT
jgi:hypothetical protein